MIDLLDVNVLVSLAWPNHVHHRVARQWFAGRHDGWATTPVTECGFVRVSSNRAVIADAVAPVEARWLLHQMCQVPGHAFFPDDVPLVVGTGHVDTSQLASHGAVTDAHLLAVARRHRARLATLDRHLAGLAGTDAVHVGDTR